jgi:ABC-2 type transport system permease protein
MRIFLTLFRRELASFFFSLSGYVIVAATTFLVGLDLVVLIKNLGGDPWPMPVTEMFYRTQFFWLIVLLASPVITMRLFALERYSGTFETLMTTPVTDICVVLAKFWAAWVFYLIMWLPMVGCLFVVQHFARQSGALEMPTVGGMFIGIALVGALFLALGCFASAITRSQMVAAMVALLMGASLYAVAYLAEHIPAAAQWQAEVVSHFALFKQMHDFVRGIVDTRSVLFLVTGTFFFLFLTLRAVESRRWR